MLRKKKWSIILDDIHYLKQNFVLYSKKAEYLHLEELEMFASYSLNTEENIAKSQKKL